MGFTASLAGLWSNGHFIYCTFVSTGQTSLGFCSLTVTFISLFSKRFRQDQQ
jgi:hypothetical protein